MPKSRGEFRAFHHGLMDKLILVSVEAKNGPVPRPMARKRLPQCRAGLGWVQSRGVRFDITRTLKADGQLSANSGRRGWRDPMSVQIEDGRTSISALEPSEPRPQ